MHRSPGHGHVPGTKWSISRTLTTVTQGCDVQIREPRARAGIYVRVDCRSKAVCSWLLLTSILNCSKFAEGVAGSPLQGQMLWGPAREAGRWRPVREMGSRGVTSRCETLLMGKFMKMTVGFPDMNVAWLASSRA